MEVLKHVPANLNQLRAYEPGKPIETVAREIGIDPNSIVKLASNESALGASRLAKRAMKAAIDEMFLYPDGGSYDIRTKLADFYDVNPSEIIIGNGSNEILEFIGHCFLAPNKKIVVSEYSFIVYRLIAKMFDAQVTQVPTINNFGHDLQAMLNAIDQDTSVVVICNPNNPTGTMVSDKEMVKFMKQVPKHVLVVLDEAYAEVCLGKMPETIKYVKENANCIVLRTFSKAYGLAGLRIGYGIAPTAIIDVLQKARQPFNTCRMSQIAACAALDDTNFVRRCRSLYRQGKNYFEDEFAKMQLEFVPTFANFILVRTNNGKRVFEELQKRGVIVRPMDGYGLPEWIRVSFGSMDENKTFIQALQEVLRK
ncbi:MAG: histidinol-phosphate transaminase [Lentisphaeria bacterium]